MEKYKCFIVDDEPLAINVIEQHLAKFTQFEVCGTSTDPLEVLIQIKLAQPDLLFLDIEMPEISGLDLIASIQQKPEIIITTAYREYAVEGFELNVLDYLVKPIPFKRFIKAIDKFLEQKLHQQMVPVEEVPSHIYVKADRKTIRILLDEILYVEGVKDYVKIVLVDRKVLTKVSIGHFFKALPHHQFVQVHKSFVVAKNKITAYTSSQIEIGDQELPVGRIYKEDFLQTMTIDSDP
jgi:DNA-binding LytR/AlgR family response regulator